MSEPTEPSWQEKKYLTELESQRQLELEKLKNGQRIDPEDRAFLLMICAVLAFLVFCVGAFLYHVQHNGPDVHDNQVKIACIQAGKSWVLNAATAKSHRTFECR